jgi:hypothetical protein
MLPWDLAQVHILPHALHYEPVCFEGLTSSSVVQRTSSATTKQSRKYSLEF